MDFIKIALDCDGVITDAPEFWAAITHALCQAGHEVHVITDIREQDREWREYELRDYGIQYTELHCTRHKNEKCKELGIDWAIDDMRHEYYGDIKDWCPVDIIRVGVKLDPS